MQGDVGNISSDVRLASGDKQQFVTSKVRKGMSGWNETSRHHFWAVHCFIVPYWCCITPWPSLIFEGFVTIKLNHSKIPEIMHLSRLGVQLPPRTHESLWQLCGWRWAVVLCWSYDEVAACPSCTLLWETRPTVDGINQKCQRVQSLSLEVQQVMIVCSDHQSHPQWQHESNFSSGQRFDVSNLCSEDSRLKITLLSFQLK